MKNRFRKNITVIEFVSISILFFFSLSSSALATDYSGTYRCEIQGDFNATEYIRIEQIGAEANVLLSWDCPCPASVINGTITITLDTSGTMVLTFSQDAQKFSGTWQYGQDSGTINGNKVDDEEWPGSACYDIDSKGVPRFVENDFTELIKISNISRFRSGCGHDYSDDFESCRSMKHYYAPYDIYRENHNIEIYSPVDGIIDSIRNEQHGSSIGLSNKQIRIKSTVQPAFIFVIFHVDLISSDIAKGTAVQAGQLLGHAHMYYPDLDEYGYSFDIAVWVKTPSGTKYISYFETMTGTLFDYYVARGAGSKYDFIISKEERDADPLICDGEQFLNSGNLSNWVNLSFTNACDFCGFNSDQPDGYVDYWDLLYFAQRWHTDPDDTNWDPRCDLDKEDDYVDYWDLLVFAQQWHKGEPP